MSNPFYSPDQRLKDTFSEYKPKAIVWCTYIIVVVGIIKICNVLIERCDTNQPQESNVTEVRVYFSNQDSIVPIIRQELDSVKQMLESMRNDSIMVKVSKTSNR